MSPISYITRADAQKIDDDGRIHISPDLQPDPALIDEDLHTVVFGHHPFEMMDKTSQKWMREFFKCYRDAQYFCGHAHSFGVDAPERIIEHTTAGLFIDNEDYNVPTFGYHKTSRDPESLIVSEYYEFDEGNWKLKPDRDTTINNVAKISLNCHPHLRRNISFFLC